MGNKKKVSLIMPVYNSEKHLPKCLDSIVNQEKKYRDQYEVFIILDVSTDNSEKIIKDYVEKYPDLFVFIKQAKRAGANGCRFAGLSKSTGEYISFLDSDDYLRPDAFKTVIETIEKTGADYINFNYYFEFNPRHQHKCLFFNQEDKFITTTEFINLFLDDRIIRGYLWNKIYKKELFESELIFYSEATSLCEDLSLNFSLGLNAKKIYLSTDAINVYNQANSASLTKTRRSDRCIQNLTAYNSMKQYVIRSKNPDYIDAFNKYSPNLFRNLMYTLVADVFYGESILQGLNIKYCKYIIEQGKMLKEPIKK